MQSFLPYIYYHLSAEVLDWRRLGKQRSETKIMLLLNLRQFGDWDIRFIKRYINHTCTRMWRGYEYQLCLYGIAICEEWISRGYNDNTLPFFLDYLPLLTPCSEPFWLGDEQFHASHRASLLFKDYDYYKNYGWTEQPKYGYIWPEKGKYINL